MYETKEEMAIRHRKEGRSEQEIAYFQADNQKDYEPILKDPNTPEKIVYDIVERITLVPLKILALAHPNIKARSIKYILEKADKKPYQKDLIQAYIQTTKMDFEPFWAIRKYYNTASRFDKFMIEIINEGVDIPEDNLLVIVAGVVPENGISISPKDKMAYDIVEAALNHPQMPEKYAMIWLDRVMDKLNNEQMVEIIKNNQHSEAMMAKIYDETNDDRFLSDELKELFVF